jgi:hypothetical protein
VLGKRQEPEKNKEEVKENEVQQPSPAKIQKV